MTEKKYILSKEVAEKKLRRMALEVVERNYDELELVLIGIKENGWVIASRISHHLKEVFAGKITVLELSMNKKQPGDEVKLDAYEFAGKVVLLIDDVANSGSVMLYALKPLLNSYPKKIQTLALVERTHKSFPIVVDYVGVSLATTPGEYIYVEVSNGFVDGAWVQPSKEA